MGSRGLALGGGDLAQAALKAGLAAGVGLSASSFLAACSDTTVPGGQSPNKAPGGLPLARPDNPVTLPIYPDNKAIPWESSPRAGR